MNKLPTETTNKKSIVIDLVDDRSVEQNHPERSD